MLSLIAAASLMAQSSLIPLPSSLEPTPLACRLPAQVPIWVGHGAEAEGRLLLSHFGGAPEFSKAASLVRMELVRSEESKLGPEGYRLSVSQEGVKLVAAQRAGLFYGIQTLRQTFKPSQGGWVAPGMEVEDVPRFQWRGLMLDCSRHFWDKRFIFKLLDSMAFYKLNTFHWHLVDDQGWRIEIKRYPQLTAKGSSRSKTVHPDGTVEQGPIGGFYTQDDVRQVVAHARDRHITVVPEIEMPGHCTAALAAFPELSCTGGPFQVGERFGIYDDIFCAGKPETFTFLQHVLDEVLDLFPSKFIHIGGDEAPKDRWHTCPDCQLKMAEEHLRNEDELQSWFIRSIDAYLNVKGRRLIGWDEILDGGLAPGATVMSWRGRIGGITAAKLGHDAVMTPTDYCYFDHYQEKKGEPKAIGGYLPLQAVYAHNPVPEKLTPEESKHILGVQANVWTEYMPTEEQVEYMVFPRLLALAEVAWTPQSLRNYGDFKMRLNGNLQYLNSQEINFRDKGLEVSEK